MLRRVEWREIDSSGRVERWLGGEEDGGSRMREGSCYIEGRDRWLELVSRDVVRREGEGGKG